MPYYPEKKPDIPEETKQETKTTEKRRKLFRVFLAVVSCLLIAYGGIRLIVYISELAASRQTSRELQKINDLAESGTDSPLPAETFLRHPFCLPRRLLQDRNFRTQRPCRRSSKQTTAFSGPFRIRTIRSWLYPNGSSACGGKANISSAGSALTRWTTRSRRRITRIS